MKKLFLLFVMASFGLVFQTFAQYPGAKPAISGKLVDRKNLSTGQTVLLYDNGDGTLTLDTQTSCYSCYGGGICSACQGRGGRSVGYGPSAIWYNCTICSGRGRCGKCAGTGKVSIIQRIGPNCNIIATYYQATGQMIYGDGSGSYSVDASKGNTNKKACSVCEGTGQQKTPIPAIRTYTERCSTCNEIMKAGSCGHIHQTCSVCRGTGQRQY